MSKWAKITIVTALLLCVAGIYLGKNVFFSRENSKPQQNEQAQQNNNEALPTLLELKTST